MRTHTIIRALALLAGFSTALPTCRPHLKVPTGRHEPIIVVDNPACPGFGNHLRGRAVVNDTVTTIPDPAIASKLSTGPAYEAIIEYLFSLPQ